VLVGVTLALGVRWVDVQNIAVETADDRIVTKSERSSKAVASLRGIVQRTR